jgi:hypothetical protein
MFQLDKSSRQGVAVSLFISFSPLFTSRKYQEPQVAGQVAGGSHPLGRAGGVSVHEMWIFLLGPTVSFSWLGGLPGQQTAAGADIL